MSKKRDNLLRYLFVLAFLLSGCAPAPKALDIQRIIFPDVCENACWMGIEPGISATEDAMRILVDNYGSENVTSEESFGGTLIVDWNSNSDAWENSGRLFVVHDTVDSISVNFSENDIVVEDIIDVLGAPDGIGLEIDTGLKIEPNSKCLQIWMLYSHSGIRIDLFPLNQSVGIHETQSVSEIFIRSPWTDDFFPWAYMLTRAGWDGYHDYCPNAWPE
jgi:hypothetical protein